MRLLVSVGLLVALSLSSQPVRAEKQPPASPRPSDRAFVIQLDGGPSAPFGTGTAPLQLGYQLGVHFGLENRAARWLLLTPELQVGFGRWGLEKDAHFLGNPISGGTSVFKLLGGVRGSIVAGPAEIYGAGHLGIGHLGRTVEEFSGLDSTNTALTWNLEAGVLLRITRHVGAGAFIAATRILTSVLGNTELAPLGLGFGLNLQLRLPF